MAHADIPGSIMRTMVFWRAGSLAGFAMWRPASPSRCTSIRPAAACVCACPSLMDEHVCTVASIERAQATAMRVSVPEN